MTFAEQEIEVCGRVGDHAGERAVGLAAEAVAAIVRTAHAVLRPR